MAHYHVLCIGLPDATARWDRVAAWLTDRVLDGGRRGTVHRVAATDGRAGPAALPADCVERMGLVARYHVARRPLGVVDPYELDSAAAAACYDSHWRCWRWLAEEAPPDVDRAIVVEDDCGPPPLRVTRRARHPEPSGRRTRSRRRGPRRRAAGRPDAVGLCVARVAARAQPRAPPLGGRRAGAQRRRRRRRATGAVHRRGPPPRARRPLLRAGCRTAQGGLRK